MGELWIDPTNQDVLIKKFRTPHNRQESQLLVDLNNLLYTIRPSAKETLKQNFSWPLDLYGSSNSITAIKIPLAPKSFYREIRMLGDTENRLMTLQYLVDREWWQSPAVESREPSISIEERVEICHHMLTTLLTLWESGGVYGDFSFMNLIWATEPTPRIMFLDADTATADNTYDRQLHSPGWREHLLPGLTPLQKDFRLSSLAIWRIFSQTLRGYPDDKNLTNALNQLQSEVRLAIQNLWSDMTMDSARDLHSVLHKYRDDRYIKLLFENAMQEGLAKHALQQIPHTPTKSEEDQILRATKWAEIEQQYETKRGRSQSRFGRIHGNNPEFALDVTNAPIPVDFDNPESIVTAFRNGDFALIAENFDQFISASPQFQFVIRAVEHALVEEPIPAVDFIEGSNFFQANWVFPATTNWINRAVLTVFDVNGVVLSQKVFQRKATRSGVRVPHDQQIASISICWRAENSTGVGVDSPNSWSTRISASHVRPANIPPAPNLPASTGPSRPRITLDTQNTFTRDLPDVQAVPPTRIVPAAAPLRVQQTVRQIPIRRKRNFVFKFIARIFGR
jgi:hypothetical protein